MCKMFPHFQTKGILLRVRHTLVKSVAVTVKHKYCLSPELSFMIMNLDAIKYFHLQLHV